MMLKATFNGMNFDNIEGYRVSCRLTKGVGFDGSFYVYIDERRQAQTPFAQTVKVADVGAGKISPIKGTLEIFSEDMNYVFKDIELKHAEMGATRLERTRYLEFAYNPLDTDQAGADPITINGKASNPGPSGLGEDYMGGLSESRHLLGFRSYVGANASTVVRFANAGCLPNSFLAKIVELNKQMQSSDKLLPDFSIMFSPQDFDINRDNLLAMFVEESRGSLAALPSFKVHEIISNPTVAIERLKYPQHSARDILVHDANNEFRSASVMPGVVETTTIVFARGDHYPNIAVK